MARYLFMCINKLLNTFHRHEKRLVLQIKQLNELQQGIKSRIILHGWQLGSDTFKSKSWYSKWVQTTVKRMAELQSRRAANSYLLDELYHELAGVRGNIRQLSEAKRRNK